MKTLIELHLDDTAKAVTNLDYISIKKAVNVLVEAKKNRATVYLFGNGGSHANASHMANDLFKAGGIKAICISEMVSTTLAYMNDFSVDDMFSSILRQILCPSDIIFAFSCSGNSPNVVKALKIRTNGVKSILLTGHEDSKASLLADIVIKVNNPNIRIQESVHSAICHAITEDIISAM